MVSTYLHTENDLLQERRIVFDAINEIIFLSFYMFAVVIRHMTNVILFLYLDTHVFCYNIWLFSVSIKL